MSKLRIAIASLQQESNTLCPVLSCKEDFDQAYGMDMLKKLSITDMLKKRDIEIIPTLYAHALPGGTLKKQDYLFFAQKITDMMPTDVDGIWLYLHGAMFVEGIGSGETYLLKMIRNKVGYDVPISLGLDFHANNTDDICSLANIICGFRTAPHTDQPETQQRAMKLLLECIDKKILPKPQIARAYVTIPGDAVQTAYAPLKDIMSAADVMEQLDGIMCAQVFNGQAWVDAPYMGPSMIVTHENDTTFAQTCATRLAEMFYEKRYDFKFLVTAEHPDKAIELALSCNEQVFLTDSGDNPTAGAAGDNAFLLNKLLLAGAKDTLVAGIMDSEACNKCYDASIGDILTLRVGGSLYKNSESAEITGKLMHTGDILGYAGDNGGRSATLELGGITLVITEQRAAFTRMDIFKSIGIDIGKYKLVVVKLGYLFPELLSVAKHTILVLTPGSSTENLADMHHKNIPRPMFPLDDNFM